MNTLPVALLLTAAALAAGCHRATEADRAPAPLPKAWPRTSVYPAAYRAVAPESDIEVVAELEPTVNPSGTDTWITVAYPAYRAALYITDTHTRSEAESSGALENRLERISLNNGGAPSRRRDFATPAGYSAALFSAPSGSLTPLQFVATGKGRVVSGSLLLDRLPASVDSLRPTLDAVEADIVHLINQLK